MVLFDLIKILVEICFRGADPLGLLDEFPTKEQDGEDEDHHVARVLSVLCCPYSSVRATHENRKFGTSQKPSRKTV